MIGLISALTFYGLLMTAVSGMQQSKIKRLQARVDADAKYIGSFEELKKEYVRTIIDNNKGL